jgi:hypothetical protein
MGWFTNLRDTAEAVGAVVGNYVLPGSGMITSQLVSDGAKKQLATDWGQLAMLGSGVGGGVNGNMSNYNSLSKMFDTGAVPTTGTELGTTTGTPDVTGGTAAATTPPPALQNTVSSGSNLDTTAGAINPTGSPNAGGPASMPDNIDVGGGYNPASGGGGPTANPGFLASMQAGNYGDAASAVGNGIMNNKIPSIYAAGSLYDMYAKNQMAKRQQSMYDQNRADIMGMYAPGSAEYNALMNEMSRKDAAAGRNSQYGVRSVDLAGKIAAYKTNAIANMQGGQNALMNQGLGNQYGMMNTPLTLAALTATQKGA